MPSPQSGRAQRPTIRDVAAVAGVSKSLVSRAFVNPEKVGAESLQRIRKAADQLGFEPSWSARSLNSTDGGFVGIIVSDLFSSALAPIVIGAYRALEKANVDVLLTSASLSEPGSANKLEAAPIAFLGGLRPSRLLIVGAVADMSQLESLARQVPTVVAGTRDVELPVAAEVFTDDIVGMRLAVEHLSRHGHTHIAHLAGIGRVGEGRAAAYVSAMEGQHLQSHIRVVESDFEEMAGYESAKKLLSSRDRPSAITTAGDPAALGAKAAARELGLETAVVGYGNSSSSSFHLTRITSVDPHNQEIGGCAAGALLSAGARDSAAPAQHRVTPSLVVR